MEQPKRAEIILVGMLLLSFVLSLGIVWLMTGYLQDHPDSTLKSIVMNFGSLKGKRISPLSDEQKFERGIIFLPFSVLALISFVIYIKFLKGDIVMPKREGVESNPSSSERILFAAILIIVVLVLSLFRK